MTLYKLTARSFVIFLIMVTTSCASYYADIAMQDLRQIQQKAVEKSHTLMCDANDETKIREIFSSSTRTKAKLNECLILSLGGSAPTISITKFLVDLGADVNYFNHGVTPVKALIRGVYINELSGDQIISQRLDVLRFLVVRGANLNFVFPDGQTYADLDSDKAFVSYLKSQGVDFSKKKKRLSDEVEYLENVLKRIHTLSMN